MRLLILPFFIEQITVTAVFESHLDIFVLLGYFQLGTDFFLLFSHRSHPTTMDWLTGTYSVVSILSVYVTLFTRNMTLSQSTLASPTANTIK